MTTSAVPYPQINLIVIGGILEAAGEGSLRLARPTPNGSADIFAVFARGATLASMQERGVGKVVLITGRLSNVGNRPKIDVERIQFFPGKE